VSRARRRADWLERHRAAGRPAGDTGPAGTAGGAVVRLHIGEITLHGLPRLSRHDLAAAAQAELTTLLTTAGLPHPLRTAGRADRLAARPISVAHGAPAAVVGRQIAGAVLWGWGS
jgi:hypothetical protein